MDKRGLCIATRCKTVDELVDRFHSCCDEGWLFVHTTSVREVGSESPFAVLLADRTIVMRGWCVVSEAWTTDDNVFGRRGMRLGVHRLTAPSVAVFDRLLAARRARDRPEPSANKPAGSWSVPRSRVADPGLATTGRSEVVADGLTKTARRAPPAAPIAETRTKDPSASPGTPIRIATQSDAHVRLVAAQPRAASPKSEPPTELRTPGSPLVLPANPFMNLTDASLEGFVECRLYEEISSQDPPREPETPGDAVAALDASARRRGTPTTPPPAFTTPAMVPRSPPSSPRPVSSTKKPPITARSGADALTIRPSTPTTPPPPAVMLATPPAAPTLARASTPTVPPTLLEPVRTTPVANTGVVATAIVVADGSAPQQAAAVVELVPPLRPGWRTLLVIAMLALVTAFAVAFAAAQWMR